MEITQIEIDFAPYLEAAIEFPETAEIKPLLDLLDQSIAPKDLHIKLSEAGIAIEKLSAVLAAKCDRTLDKWDAKWNPREPVLDLNQFPGLFVEPCINLDSLLEPQLDRYYPKNRESATQGSNAERGETLVAEIDQHELANAVAELPEAQALEQAISLAHSEDIDAWIEIVRLTLTQPTGLSELVEKLDLSIVQIWIALMFGGFQLERSGDFYEGSIVVSPTKNPPQAL
jgi:hypothetical protein